MAKKFKYTNKSKMPQVVIGVGEVKPGKEIESDHPINNPNLTMVGVASPAKPVSQKELEKKAKKANKK